MPNRDPFDVGPPGPELSVAEGDVVMLGRNGAFTLEIMAVRGDKAWVRDLDDGRQGIVDLDGFRKYGREARGTLQ
jgi:hypothetical protein